MVPDDNFSTNSISNGSDTSSLRGRSEESKSSGGTYSNTSRKNNGESASQQQLDETHLVRSSKACLYVFLLVVAIGGSLLTWVFLRQEGQISLAEQFEVVAEEISAVSTINAQFILALYEAESLQMTTHALSSAQEWPFLTFPGFEAEGDLLINQTKTGNYMALHPLVTDEQRKEWEIYASRNLGWLQDAQDFHGIEGNVTDICPWISKNPYMCAAEDSSPNKLYAPIWQIAPGVGSNQELVNTNGFRLGGFDVAFERMMETRKAVLYSDATNLDGDTGYPESLLVTPVRQDVSPDSPIVALISAFIPWNVYFENLLAEGKDGIALVVSSEMQDFTFEINGPQVRYIGANDTHDPAYDSFVHSYDFASVEGDAGALGFTLSVYPTQQFEEDHTQNRPRTYTLAVAFVFFFAISVFLIYDFFVDKRQAQVMLTANKSSAIINSLFPANVRDRLMEEQQELKKERRGGNAFKVSTAEVGRTNQESSKPIADLFTEATVMFGDIAGFTAWSSIRQPSQVFLLLETVYNSFDKIARKMKVFKVETIGDSYVAVAGLPNPRKDHAEVMAGFAHKCMVKMNTLVHRLELTLGPGTSELKMRFGLHSGPVTAGVLRGEKSRFQLFGDTVNTAARMESTGEKNRIQLSKETADLLIAAGKEDMIRARATKVFAKGKGDLQTYWYIQGSVSAASESTEDGPSSGRDASNSNESNVHCTSDRHAGASSGDSAGRGGSSQTLIRWNVENLSLPLKKLVVSREGQRLPDLESWRKIKMERRKSSDDIVLDEVEEVISMPERRVADLNDSATSVVLAETVRSQLTDYVATIASMYRPNAFHSFDHASHVTQSVTKLLARVVTPDQICYDSMSYAPKAAPEILHDFTFGITSNPMIHFAVIFSALIHDVDHPGVPNVTLVKEGTDMAKAYRNKSVAEQNSVDLAWDLLMEPKYEDLRRCIYTTQTELESFRKLVVNAVLATDVVDKELGYLRKRRWELAFGVSGETCAPGHNPEEEASRLTTNRKATIVIEYMIQASDVSHTMQHWQIYTHWNEKFFHECYNAFSEGRTETDPTETWYDGELGFFDYYVIPLAKRLKECGVFGVSGDEYLNYAVSPNNIVTTGK